MALLATLAANGLESLTGFNIIDKNIMSLLFGIVAHELGFLESGVLVKANANGLAMAALMTVVFASLANATPTVLVEIIKPILIAQVLGVAGYAIFAFIVGKALNVSPYLAIAIGSTANYGFPGTYVISKEVSKAVGETPEQKEMILDAILPKMLVGGFVTVSIASVFLASIVAAFV